MGAGEPAGRPRSAVGRGAVLPLGFQGPSGIRVHVGGVDNGWHSDVELAQCSRGRPGALDIADLVGLNPDSVGSVVGRHPEVAGWRFRNIGGDAGSAVARQVHGHELGRLVVAVGAADPEVARVERRHIDGHVVGVSDRELVNALAGVSEIRDVQFGDRGRDEGGGGHHRTAQEVLPQTRIGRVSGGRRAHGIAGAGVPDVEIVAAFGQVRIDRGNGLGFGIAGQQQGASLVVEVQAHIQVAATRHPGRCDPGVDRELDPTGSGHEREDVHVCSALEHPLIRGVGVGRIVFGSGGDDVGAAGEHDRGGGAGGIAVVIGAIGNLARNGGQIVLGVARQVILPFAPLADVAVVAGSHDRSPGDVAAPMATVILGPVGLPVVAEAQVVADLVCRGLADVVFGVGEVVMVDPGGPVFRVAGGAKDVHIRHAPRLRRRVGLAVGVRVPRDERVRGARVEARGSFRGDVDVERRVVFRHPLPDPLDDQLLRIAVGRQIRVGTEGNGGYLRPPHLRIPLGVDDRLAGKVEIQDIRRAGPAVERQARRERAYGHRRRRYWRVRGIILRLCRVAHRRSRTDEVDASVCIRMQRRQVFLGEMEALQPTEGALLRGVRQLLDPAADPALGQLIEPVQIPHCKLAGWRRGLGEGGACQAEENEAAYHERTTAPGTTRGELYSFHCVLVPIGYGHPRPGRQSLDSRFGACRPARCPLKSTPHAGTPPPNSAPGSSPDLNVEDPIRNAAGTQSDYACAGPAEAATGGRVKSRRRLFKTTMTVLPSCPSTPNVRGIVPTSAMAASTTTVPNDRVRF